MNECPSVLELPHIDDIYLNEDGSLEILFCTLTTVYYLSNMYPDLFESRYGEKTFDNEYYKYFGVIKLWEGEGHCYAKRSQLGVFGL